MRHTRNLIKILESHEINPKMGAEIGVRFGRNAFGLLKHFTGLHLFLVDSYEGRQPNAENAKQKAIKRLNEFDKSGNEIRWIFEPSHVACRMVDNKSLDFVFIDASHDYDSVRRDINCWLPKVKSGGLLLGHDFSDGFDGLKRAVVENFGGDFSVEGDIWFVKK